MRVKLLFYAVYTLFVLLFINGCLHSFRKHPEDPNWLQYSPLAIYRGVEYFWHDDFAGVNWDKRLSSDVYVAMELMMKIQNTTEVETLSSEFEKFSNKISDYPGEKKEYIKNAIVNFVNYSLAVSEDMVSFIEEIKGGKSVNYSEWDITSKQYKDTLVRRYDMKELDALKGQIDSTLALLIVKHRFGEITGSEMEKMQNEFKNSNIRQLNAYLRFYQILFDEPFPQPKLYL